MSDSHYEVTALKYRPQTFSEVIGQDHITRTLQNALETRQVAHAYLFAGPRGTGKTTTARLLAKALNCRSADEMVREPCGECESCIAIGKGLSVDVMEIDGASNNSVDQIRELRETVRYAAFEGRYKVYIIDEVHMLSQAAFNALLKTLEEPPEHVIFVFATTEPHKVIPTIISRVQRYDFRRIGIGAMAETLTRIIEAEDFTAEPEALHLIAAKADGSLRDAESLLDQVRAFTGTEITLEGARTVLGIVDAERFFRLTRLAAHTDAAGALNLAAELVEEGQDPFEFMLGYAEHLRYLIAAAAGGESTLEALLENERAEYLATADLLGLEDYLRMLEFTGEIARSLQRSPQPWIELEAAFLRLVHMDRSVDLRSLLEKIDAHLAGKPAASPSGKPAPPPSGNPTRTKRVPAADPGPTAATDTAPEGAADPGRVGTAPADPPPAEQAERVAENGGGKPPLLARDPGPVPGRDPGSEDLPPVDSYEEEMPPEEQPELREKRTDGSARIGEVQGKWKEIVEEVRRRKVALGVFLSEARLTGVKDNNLLLAFEGGNHTFHINQVTRHSDLIRDVTRQLCGHPLGVTCLRDDPANAGREPDRAVPARSSDLNSQLLERLCSQNENLKTIVDLFNARLEDGPGGR